MPLSPSTVAVLVLIHFFFILRNQPSSAQPAECYDVPTGVPSQALPLCGNGVLDAGEICDDGNTINFDGCNAFCSAFDGMSAAATLAGGPTAGCSAGGGGTSTLLGGTTSQVQFCNLRAIDASLDGTYVVMADVGTLLRYDLYTDQLVGNIQQLQASIDRSFVDICSLAVLEPDASIAFHDCGAQHMFVAMADGSHVQQLADWSALFVSSNSGGSTKAYYDKQARKAAVAGVLQESVLSTASTNVIGVQLLNISRFQACQPEATFLPFVGLKLTCNVLCVAGLSGIALSAHPAGEHT